MFAQLCWYSLVRGVETLVLVLILIAVLQMYFLYSRMRKMLCYSKDQTRYCRFLVQALSDEFVCVIAPKTTDQISLDVRLQVLRNMEMNSNNWHRGSTLFLTSRYLSAATDLNLWHQNVWHENRKCHSRFLPNHRKDICSLNKKCVSTSLFIMKRGVFNCRNNKFLLKKNHFCTSFLFFFSPEEFTLQMNY